MEKYELKNGDLINTKPDSLFIKKYFLRIEKGKAIVLVCHFLGKREMKTEIEEMNHKSIKTVFSAEMEVLMSGTCSRLGYLNIE